MDLPGFAVSPRLSGGSSGYSLSGGLSGFLGSGGSNELWSLGSGAAQQQQQQQQYNVGAGMGSGGSGGMMMMGGYPGGHMQQPSMASQVGTQGAVVGMGHQAPPPLVHRNVTSTPSSGTDGEHRDRFAPLRSCSSFFFLLLLNRRLRSFFPPHERATYAFFVLFFSLLCSHRAVIRAVRVR